MQEIAVVIELACLAIVHVKKAKKVAGFHQIQIAYSGGPWVIWLGLI